MAQAVTDFDAEIEQLVELCDEMITAASALRNVSPDAIKAVKECLRERADDLEALLEWVN